MPLFQVDIEKSFLLNSVQTVYWTNVYHVNAADQAAATTAGLAIVEIERDVHYNSVIFTKMRARPAVVGSLGNITSLNVTGDRAAAGLQMLPLFNTIRVDFNTAVGRPSRKYIRGPIAETDQDGGNLVSAMQTLFSTSFRAPLLALGSYVDVDGEAFVSGQVYVPVQMRQLRRGSKRKTTPVI